MPVLLKDIRRVLAKGGFVRYTWAQGREELITATGRSLRIDGRTYQGFLKTVAPELQRIETGSTHEKNLVIEWRPVAGA